MITVVVLSDFDGTMTGSKGERTISQPVYRSLFVPKPGGQFSYGDDRFKSAQDIQDILENEFGGKYDINNLPRQGDTSLLISPEAVRAFKEALQNPNISLNIVTKNRPEYVKALLKYQGFSDDEISRINIMALRPKYDLVSQLLHRIGNTIAANPLFIVKDDNIEDYMSMARAARHYGIQNHTTVRLHGRSLQEGTYDQDWTVTRGFSSLSASVVTFNAIPPETQEQERLADIDLQLRVLPERRNVLASRLQYLDVKPVESKSRFSFLRPFKSQRESPDNTEEIAQIQQHLTNVTEQIALAHEERKKVEQEITERKNAIPTEATLFSRGTCTLKVGLNADGSHKLPYQFSNGKDVQCAGSLQDIREYIINNLAGAQPNITQQSLLNCIDKVEEKIAQSAQLAQETPSSVIQAATTPTEISTSSNSSARNLPKRSEAHKQNLTELAYPDKGYEKVYDSGASRLYKEGNSDQYIFHFGKREKLSGCLDDIKRKLIVYSNINHPDAESALIDLGTYIVSNSPNVAQPKAEAPKDSDGPADTNTSNHRLG